ncbi:hypothetical protein BCR42DRAFT_423554 [Absidia repens]|uniref:Uncharacterized protein n=1 Tax=Absidia repens TaxID=90262 RepID=A0A1X2I4X5_9FUNG|nr:hypothetical protein BCR42DRAFT_423554 [Absidia repens]
MHPISPSNASLPPRLDDTSIILLGGAQNTIHPMNDNNGNDLTDTAAALLSPCIELAGYDMPSSMIVPMINREEEMHQVVQRNPGYFVQVQQQVVDEHTFKKFQSTLYATRHQLNDQDWLKRIEHFLVKLSPSLWERFQALVDHYPAPGPSHQTPPHTPITDVSTPSVLSARPPLLSQLHEQKYNGQEGLSSCSTSTLDTSSSFRYLYDDHGYFFDPQIRQKKSFPTDVMPFLQECKMAMEEEEYGLFVHWLLADSSKINNEYWESALYECLNHHPILFLKLKDWIDHELE